MGEHELSLSATLTTFGTPRDIPYDDEIAVELFPADDHTDARLSAP